MRPWLGLTLATLALSTTLAAAHPPCTCWQLAPTPDVLRWCPEAPTREPALWMGRYTWSAADFAGLSMPAPMFAEPERAQGVRMWFTNHTTYFGQSAGVTLDIHWPLGREQRGTWSAGSAFGQIVPAGCDEERI